MVDIACYVDFDAEAECDIKENVRFDVLCEILDSCENEDDLKEMLRSRADELVPNHITVDDIFATINYLNCVAHGVGNTDDIRPPRQQKNPLRRRTSSEPVQNRFLPS